HTRFSRDWSSDVCSSDLAPARIGALFPGVPLMVAGRFRGAPSGSLSVRGTGPNGTAWEQHATATVTENTAATSLWARAHLRDLRSEERRVGKESRHHRSR